MVTHSQTVTAAAKTDGFTIVATVVTTAPISTTNITGWWRSSRGRILRSASGSSCTSWRCRRRPGDLVHGVLAS